MNTDRTVRRVGAGARRAPPDGGGSRRGSGFTLAEMVFASTLSAVMVLVLLQVFSTHMRAYRSQRLVREAEQNVRTALDTVARDLRMAGYGLLVPDAELAQWISWVPGFSANPLIVEGATPTAPDTLRLAAAFDAPVATLANATAGGSTVIQVASGQGAAFNTTDRSVLCIGRLETVRVAAISGDRLTVSAEPASSRGLRYAYPAGTPVERVSVVTYSWRPAAIGFPAYPYLAREDGRFTGTNMWQNMLAGYIEDFQVARQGDSFTVRVTGVTRTPDPAKDTGGTGTAYTRVTAATEVAPRNAAIFRVRY